MLRGEEGPPPWPCWQYATHCSRGQGWNFCHKAFERMVQQDFQVLPLWTAPACAGAWGCSLTDAGLYSPSWTAWASPQPILPTHPGPFGRPLNPVLYQLLQLEESAPCPSTQMLDSIGLSLLPAVLCATDCTPLIASYSSSFQSTSLSLSSCLLPEQQCRDVPESSTGPCPLPSTGPGAFPARQPCCTLFCLACLCSRTCSYLSSVHCPCVPTSQGSCCQPYLLSHYFWCNALTAQLTSLSTDTFAPYSQTECLPFTLVEEERQYDELELRDSNSIEMQLWKKGFVTVFQSCQMIWLSHTLKVWYTEIFAWCVLSGKCLDIWLHSYMC